MLQFAATLINTVAIPLRVAVWAGARLSPVAVAGGKLAWRSMLGRQEPHKPGDAFWSDLPHLRKLGHLEHTGGFYIGKMYKSEMSFGPWSHRAGMQRIFTDAESSVVMVGKKKSGKSQSIIADIRASALLPEEARPDKLIYDPVGEIQQATEAHLKAMGYAVRVINLDDPTAGEQCDPLQVLRPGMRGHDFMLELLGKALIPDAVRETGHEHFPEGARGAIIASIAYHQQLLKQPGAVALDACMEAIADKQDALKALIAAMRASPSAVVRNSIKTLQVVSEKEFGSFVSTMTRYFRPFLYDDVVATYRTRADADGVCVPGINFLDIFRGQQRTAIFIRTGLYGKVPGPFLRLTMSNAINTKRWLLNVRDPKVPYHKVPGLQRGLKIYTDETKTLGNCTALVDANDELRKARVNTFTCWLSAADIYNNISEAKNLLGGAALVIPGGSNDYETLQNISRLIGDKREEAFGRSVSKAGVSESMHEHFRPLASPQMIRQIPRSMRLVVMDQIQLKPDNPWGFEKGVGMY